jgi:hypothetical protein
MSIDSRCIFRLYHTKTPDCCYFMLVQIIPAEHPYRIFHEFVDRGYKEVRHSYTFFFVHSFGIVRGF